MGGVAKDAKVAILSGKSVVGQSPAPFFYTPF